MAAKIKTLVAMEEGIDMAVLQASLPADDSVQVVGVVEGLEQAWEVMQETNSDLLVVACNGDSDRALFLIDGAIKAKPDRPVVVLYTGSPNGFVRRVFEAGADDIVGLPQTPENVQFVIEKAIARRLGGAGASGIATSPLICVLGPKGGTGKTLTSCNLAVTLAASGNRVAVVDLDLQFGDVALSLGMSPDRTLYDLAKSGGTLDADKLDGYLMAHSSGVRVLAAPTRPDHASAISVSFLRDVYAVLRSSYDYVIVDTPPGFTPEVIASIDSSTDICMVGMLDSLSLKNTKLGLETLELMGYDRSRIRLVLNRADSKVGITKEDVAAIVGRSPDVTIPSDREVPRAVNEGSPVALYSPRSEVATAFRTLAAKYALASSPANATKSRKLFRRKKG
jgi:pilus assembly protein CpaE